MPAEELVGVNRKERLRTEVDSIGLDTLMSESFEAVSPSDTVNAVLKKMKELDIHEVPVTSDGKRLLGWSATAPCSREGTCPSTPRPIQRSDDAAAGDHRDPGDRSGRTVHQFRLPGGAGYEQRFDSRDGVPLRPA